jgi:hypothetical protein
MLKVRIHQIGQATGAVGASIVVASGAAQTAGCKGDPPTPARESLGHAFAQINAGRATLELQAGSPTTPVFTLTNATLDEFVRVDQLLVLSVPAWIAWETLYPSDPMPSDDVRLGKLSFTARVAFLDVDHRLTTATVRSTKLVGSAYAAELQANELRIPAKTDTLRVTITFLDGANAAAKAETAPTDVPVFGGELPDKTLLFDNDSGGTKRTRVVDLGNLIARSTVTLGVSDWRADEIVDKLSLNTQIGTATFTGRFGAYEAPIYGSLSYEVYIGTSVDGGATFAAEQRLAADTASRMLGPGRTAYVGSLALPATCTQLLAYLHVKAFLTADYSKYPSVKTKWYADGQVIQIKEAWDNPSGPSSNYQVPVDPP